MRNAWRVSADSEQFYEIAVAEPLLGDGNDALVRHGWTPGRRFVILDSGLPGEWRDRFAAYFAKRGVEATFMVVAGGERCKTMETATAILQELQQFGLDRRNEPIIVVGGGAVLDVAGFAASVYRRGVPFIRVPTTLLAYVDASVGIKTGINFSAGKNLVGSFYAPELVLLDRTFLESLPPREIASGLGEVLKLALGCDPELFELLDAYADQQWDAGFRGELGMRILDRSITVMLEQLQNNMYERDLCRAVDLGHTFSQAFEIHSAEEVRHGEAVALDLNLSAIIAAGRGLLSEDDVRRLTDLTARLGLPTEVPHLDPERVWQSLVERTQHRGGRHRTPIPCQIGKCVFLDDLTRDEVLSAFTALRDTHFLEPTPLTSEAS